MLLIIARLHDKHKGSEIFEKISKDIEKIFKKRR